MHLHHNEDVNRFYEDIEAALELHKTVYFIVSD